MFSTIHLEKMEEHIDASPEIKLDRTVMMSTWLLCVSYLFDLRTSGADPGKSSLGPIQRRAKRAEGFLGGPGGTPPGKFL